MAVLVDSVASKEALPSPLPSMEEQKKKAQQRLAYLLVVELLAYQFASPVQWIETQEVLLEELKCKNFIEIGPSDVLLGMMKKTLQANKQKEAVRGLNRRLLSVNASQKDLYRGLTTDDDIEDDSPANDKDANSQEQQQQSPVTPAAAAPAQSPADITAAATAAAVKEVVNSSPLEDRPVTAKDVVLAILGSKLGKPASSIAMDKSVKELAGGRSILENEIIGELETEFGSTPEQGETMSIRSLCDRLHGANFSGQLGKVTKNTISKMLSSKMPGGYDMSRIRGHLEARWGAGPGLQDMILLRASAQQPKTRLADASAAEAFWDTHAHATLGDLGLSRDMSAVVEVKTAHAAARVSLPDPQQAIAQSQAFQTSRTAELEVQARALGIDIHSANKIDEQAQQTLKALQAEIDRLTAELGDNFINGIKGHWSPDKARTFDSSWNWVLQDMLTIYYGILRKEYTASSRPVALSLRSLKGRASPRLADVARYLKQTQAPTSSPSDQAVDFLEQAIAEIEASNSTPSIASFAAYAIESNLAPRTDIDEEGNVTYSEVPRTDMTLFSDVELKLHDGTRLCEDQQLSNLYQRLLGDAMQSEKFQQTLAGKNILMTGAGKGSIGLELLKGLLTGGASVIVTTSSFSPENMQHFREIYQSHGSKGSRLIVVPFNQASSQDCESLIQWIYDPAHGLGMDLDHIIPFAAISEVGREVDKIDSKSELAHRLMLTNLYRLLGHVKQQKETCDHRGRVTQVLLPLSPNHGSFGGDGLYAESKLGLEALYTKWYSESWSDSMSICGASIGWTRGTGLMKSNDLVSQGIEEAGVRTFSAPEMALYLLLLMCRPIAETNEMAPIHADLTGGMGDCGNLKEIVSKVRSDIDLTVQIRKAVAMQDEADRLIMGQPSPKPGPQPNPRCANMRLEFPRLSDYAAVKAAAGDAQLEGMLALDRVVVVTGFGEVGPWGSARTRWEMESDWKLSLEGCIEMAWIMGMIKYHDGDIAGKHYIGWIDTQTSQPIPDPEVKARYEKQILAHSGIRLVEPELDLGYGTDATRRSMLQEIVLNEDMLMTVSEETAANLKLEHGDLVDVYQLPGTESGEVRVRMKKGARIMVPKALNVPHAIAGQIPTGWDPRVYGIPDDIISQVDRVTLFALVSVAEALLTAGITDAYELYQYIHVSEVGNCIGSGLGGVHALKDVFRARHHDLPVQSDVLQETFINTTAAWVNMLLISGAGAIRTPVGACATALESLESGYELITNGQTKMCLVGGVDNLDQDISVEFANMGATVDPAEEEKAGRAPNEASRPTTSTRKGFVEAQGGGVQILTSARLALDMGLPIYGIVAMANTASDKVGRSVPAPGQGLLGNAREKAGKYRSPMLDLNYRRRRLEARLRQIEEAKQLELEVLKLEETSQPLGSDISSLLQERRQWIEAEAERQRNEVLATYGHRFWAADPEIAPIRGALSVWGLTIDDLDFASFHGTSTTKNDLNETGVIQRQLSHLGRTEGNVLFSIFQKYLTGHSKGGAAAWMLNGCLQVLDSGLVPGHRNADNIDAELQDRSFLFYPSHSIQTTGVKAFSITSFGFGQKGAQAIGVHPRYLFAAIGEDEYERYRRRVKTRTQKASQAFTRALALNDLCPIKSATPWAKGQEEATLLDPTTRLFGSQSPLLMKVAELQ
ncbi:Fatty acid synthase subunit alpha [Exophiala dermatitidis]